MIQVINSSGTSFGLGTIYIFDANGKLKFGGTGGGGGSGTVTSISTTAPLTGGTITTSGTIGIDQADSTTDGYLSSTDWNTFNNKFDTPSGTTSQYVRGNGTLATFPSIPTVGTWGALNYPTWSSGTPFVKMTAAGTFSLDTTTYLSSISSSDVTTALGYTPVTDARTLTINGTTQDLSADRSWTITTGGGILNGVASGADAYTATITGATPYAEGDAYLIRFTDGNTTEATLDINSNGAIPLHRNNGGVLRPGDILDGAEMLCVYNSTTVAFQVIGTSPNSLITYVTNDDSVTITKGQPVYASGGQGDRLRVKLAYNTGDATSAQTIGLVMSTSIAAGQKGLIMMQGLLDGLSIVKPNDGWADGDAIYLGATAGTITKTKQYAPNHLVYLGFVTTANNGSAGRIYVRVQNGYEMDELHNVSAQSPNNNDTLKYNSTTQLWEAGPVVVPAGMTWMGAFPG